MAKKTQYALKKPANDPSFKRVESNLPAKKYKHTNPTQLRLSFELSGGGTKFIDIAQALSIVNRKLYRQGVYYYVNSIECYNNSDALVDIAVIPDTWVTRNAYIRAKSVFDGMNDLVLDNQRTIVPKYHDFKVYMSDRHRTTGSTAPSLHDINGVQSTAPDGNPGAKAADDWSYSQLVSADDDNDVNQQADNMYLHMLGDHTGTPDDWLSVGIIRSYAETRARMQAGPLVEEANIRADPITNLLDYSREEQINDIVDRLAADNDAPPYDADTYIGEHVDMQQVCRLFTTATNGRAVTAPGFCAPLGLICVDSQVAGGDAYRIVLNIAPGTYNGVYAERI